MRKPLLFRCLLFRCLLSLLVSLVFTCPAWACDPGNGYAIAMGGAVSPDNESIWARVVESAGGKDARFVVIAVASEKPEQAAAAAVAALTRRGAQAQYLPLLAPPPSDSRSPPKIALQRAWVKKINAATGVFFTGGAQARITDALLPAGVRSPMLDAICALQERGGVVAGTSAGAAVMSERMFRDPPDTLTVMQRGLVAGSDIDSGLGFAGPSVFVDQHFLRRGRIGRLLVAMQTEDIELGIGVDEDSAALVHGGTVEAIGSHGIIIADLAGASSDATLGAFNLQGARLHYLEQGDRFDMRTRSVQPAPLKLGAQLLDPAMPDYKPYYADGAFYADLLGPNMLLTAMSRLMDSATPEINGLAFAAASLDAVNTELGFRFRLYKGAHSRAWLATVSGDQRYTMQHVYMDVEPVRMAQPLHLPWRTKP